MNVSSHSEEHQSLEVAEIFRRYGEEYRAGNGMTKKQHQVMHAIAHCRTSVYGFHVDRCVDCGYTESEYNSCRDRHCPKCQAIARRKWVEERVRNLLPVSYYHVIFTLPHYLHGIIRYNRERIYDLLFSTAAETLSTFGRDPKWLGGELGFFGVLHTWGQTLWQHPHIHFIVAGGALSDEGQWIPPRFGGKFLFPVKALSKVFRGKFVASLKQAYADGGLVIPDDQSRLRHPANFERWIDGLVARPWVVYCKAPFNDAEHVVRYVGRYTHRVAISNQRLIDIENGTVRFWFKDYKKDTLVRKQMRLEAKEFISRFLWHVLPHRFHKIRHFGFLANGRCKVMVDQIRSLIAAVSPQPDASPNTSNKRVCPKCETGWLISLLVKDGYGRIVRLGPGLSMNKLSYDTS